MQTQSIRERLASQGIPQVLIATLSSKPPHALVYITDVSSWVKGIAIAQHKADRMMQALIRIERVVDQSPFKPDLRSRESFLAAEQYVEMLKKSKVADAAQAAALAQSIKQSASKYPLATASKVIATLSADYPIRGNDHDHVV